jgi:hypothetical protein
MNEIQTNPDFKGVYLRSYIKVLFLNQNNNRRTINICQNELMNIPIVIYTVKNFYLLDEINEQLSHLKSSGLLWYWRLKTIRKNTFKVDFKRNRKILSYENLKGCFRILLVGYGLSFVIFVFELWIKKFKGFDETIE